MAQPNNCSWRKLRSRGTQAAELDKLLNLLYALDQSVVELSMHVYKVPLRDRAAMRAQNRQVHDMVREQLAAIPLTRLKDV